MIQLILPVMLFKCNSEENNSFDLDLLCLNWFKSCQLIPSSVKGISLENYTVPPVAIGYNMWIKQARSTKQ